MRRDSTPTLIDAGGRPHPLERIPFRDREFSEDYLQATLHACPELLPLEDFDEEFSPLVALGREVAAVDNLFISPSGRLTIVETKLWRNPEATRTVVAQVLDYATRVAGWSYEDLERNCRGALAPAPLASTSLHALVSSHYPDETPPEHEFHDSVQRNLDNGRFLLLVVGDGIREGLEGMLGALHTHPRLLFTFGLVELQVFVDPGARERRLIVPHVLANSVEIVRAVVRVESTGTGQANVSVEIDDAADETGGRRKRRRLSEDEFFGQISSQSDADTVRQLLDRARELGAIVQPRAASVSVRLRDPGGTRQKLTLFVINTDAELYTGWLAGQLDGLGCDTAIADDWLSRLERLFPSVRRNPDRPDEMYQPIPAAQIDPVMDDLVEDLAAVIGAIREVR